MIKLIRKISGSTLFLNSSIASVDQAILSALNFTISIILIKTVTKVEFGYYSIAFAVVQFLISVQSSIVNTPLAVLLVEKTGVQRQKYPASLCYGQFIVIIPAMCLGLAAGGLMYLYGFDTVKSSLVAAISIAAIGLFSREFLRAYHFADETPLRVLKLDVFYVLLFMSLLICSLFLNRLNIAAVFILSGISGFVVSVFFARRTGWQFDLRAVKESYRENWVFGKWALLGVIVTHLQNYSFIYLVGALLGSAAVAEVSAARLLMTPLLLAQIGWGKIVLPHGSRLREHNQTRRFFKQQVVICLIFITCIIAYIVVMISLSGILNRFLFTQSYADSFVYFKYWGVFFVIFFIALSASYGLQVLKKFSILSKVNVFTMLVTVGCAYFFIQSFGIIGGFAALILGGALAAAFFWYIFAKNVFSREEDRSTARVKKESYSRA